MGQKTDDYILVWYNMAYYFKQKIILVSRKFHIKKNTKSSTKPFFNPHIRL